MNHSSQAPHSESLAEGGWSPGFAVVDRAAQVARLRELVHGDEPLVLPGVTSPLLARVVQAEGFGACYVTGAGIANFEYGYPDVGLVTQTEMAQAITRIAAAASIPLVVDADTGYGGPLSVMRTVVEFERAGAAGIQLEDQSMPKRCGHFDGKELIPAKEMVARIEAARRARTSDTLIIARTDARAVEGFDAAIERARIYAAAGADALFVEAPESVEELERIPALLPDLPLVVNIVEGGRTPELGVDQLARMGYSIILHANLIMRAVVRTAQRVSRHLLEQRESGGLADQMLSWRERQELVELARYDALDSELDAASDRVVAAAATRAETADG